MPKFYTFGLLFLIIGLFPNVFAQTFTSSNLPIIVITTGGQTISDDPKVNVKMGIIDNGPGNRNYYRNPSNNNLPDPFNNYNGTVGIEHRGSSSQFFPKKPYGFETRTEIGDDLKVSLLGMPKESDWILNASYTDKTLMRDVLTYHLSNQMGMYATRTKFVELVVDGDYKGVYILMEKIKRDTNRVNIASLKPTDNSGDALTGGYILKVDKNTGSADAYWKSPYPANNLMEINIMIEYPKKDDITTEQFEYIKNHFTNFEHTLNGPNFKDPTNGYAKYIDVNTFVDYFLLTELTYNIDAYRLSVFFYKDRDSRDPKIKMGPAWDYDHSYGNANYCKGWETNHWAYDFVREFCPQDDKQTPIWWGRLLQDREFCLKVRERWQQLRQNQWTNSNITNFVNQNVALLGESQVRNFQRWPLLGEWIWPNYYWGNTYQEEIDWFKNWTEQRLSWLDANIPRVGALANEPADCASVTKPTVSSPVNYCIGQTASALTAGGVSLKWYTQATGGTGNAAAPTPSTSNAGTTSYYVTQTINSCESTRAQIDVVVAAQAVAPTATTSIEYCQGQTAVALTANGSNLKWYNAPFGGSGSTTATVPSTSAATLTSYFVSQTVNGCESSRTQINVNVKNRPDIPHTVAALNYCQGQTALQLSASGTALLWYTVATGGTGNSGAPIPSTSSVGTNSYFVSQTLNGCESNRAEIKVTVGTKTTAPNASNLEYCQGQAASPLTAVGNDLLWYTSSTGGESSTTAPTPSTVSPNILSYFVSQTVGGCESSRTQVMVTVRSKPGLPEVANTPSYCQGDATNPLSATGSNLKWYDIAVGGTASSTAPSPSSATARTVAYYVSQTVNSCESNRAMIPVTIKAKPTPPTVSGSVSYAQGQVPSALSASGTSLKWYSSSTGGTGNLTAPTPSTSSTGSTSYYVSQTVNGCESDRSLITVLVNPPSQVTACIETKVLLEGAMNGTTMYTKLNQLGLLPGQTPKDALATKTAAGQPYKNAPWNYPGNEGFEIYAPDVVDWVLVSLRTSPEEATSTIFKTSGLLFKDGTVQTTGACPVVNPSQTLFVTIEHRNHIGAVSHDAVAVVNNKISYDFTKRQSYVPAGLPASGQLQVGTVFCLFAADSYKTSFAEVNANDATIWINDNGKFGLYKLSDFNLDGEINANDNSIWRRNNGKFSGVKF